MEKLSLSIQNMLNSSIANQYAKVGAYQTVNPQQTYEASNRNNFKFEKSADDKKNEIVDFYGRIAEEDPGALKQILAGMPNYERTMLKTLIEGKKEHSFVASRSDNDTNSEKKLGAYNLIINAINELDGKAVNKQNNVNQAVSSVTPKFEGVKGLTETKDDSKTTTKSKNPFAAILEKTSNNPFAPVEAVTAKDSNPFANKQNLFAV